MSNHKTLETLRHLLLLLGALNGRPTISFDRCTASAGSFSVRFHGGARFDITVFIEVNFLVTENHKFY